MSLIKLFNRIYWNNNTTPALNETNLNAMSKAIDDIDDRVIDLAGTIMEDVPAIQEYLSQADELVDQMEELSTNPPYIGSNGNWYVWDTNTGAYVDSNVDASITVAIADVTMLAPTATPYVTNTGTNTDPIFHLFIPRGKGITSIAKTSTSGLVDTYTITYSDGYTDTFNVTNAKSIVSIAKTSTSGLVDTYTITYNVGDPTTFTVTNGKTAYQSAVEGGYVGTEAQFESDLANFGQWKADAEQGASDAEAYAKGTRNGTAVGSSDPAYHNNAQYFAGLSDTSAQASAGSATSAAGSASDSEAYGAGTRNGVPVSSSDPAYHNNAPYYAQQAAGQTLEGLQDVDIDSTTLADGNIIAYDAATQKFKNVPLKTAVIQNVPSQSGSLTYNGSSQSPTWNNYNSNIMTIGGTTSGTNAGTYTATFTPAVGYCWDDYSTGPKSITWTIGQATGAVTLSKSSVTLDTNTLSDIVTASGATGDLSVSSSDTTVATASVSGSTITISSVNNTTGSATITVTVAASADGNYTAGSATISVAAQFKPLFPFGTATDAQLTQMIAAFYNGDITLADVQSVWSLGDERNVNLSAIQNSNMPDNHRAQTVRIVIIDFEHDNLTTPINGHTKALITVQQDYALISADDVYPNTNTENGYINSVATSPILWKNTERRTWCNNYYKNALPSYLKELIKTVSKKCMTTYYSSYTAYPSLEDVNDDVWLVSAGELLPSTSSTSELSCREGTTYAYYETEVNRYKGPYYESGSPSGFWTRTIATFKQDGKYYYTKYSKGDKVSSDVINKTFQYGCSIVPAFCL